MGTEKRGIAPSGLASTPPAFQDCFMLNPSISQFTPLPVLASTNPHVAWLNSQERIARFGPSAEKQRRAACSIGYVIACSFRLFLFHVRRTWDFPLNEFEIKDEDRVDHWNQQQGDEGRAEHSAHLRVTHWLPKRPAAKGQRDKRN